MSESKKSVGRPIGSTSKYTINPNKKKCGGRPRLILTEDEIELRKAKQRACMLKCYNRKRDEKLKLRENTNIRDDKINAILNFTRKQLENDDEMIEKLYNSLNICDLKKKV